MDNKLLAAWCHAPIPFGTIVPIVVWLLKRGSDKKLAFEAKQAAVWQMVGGIFIGILAAIGGVVTAVVTLAAPALSVIAALVIFGGVFLLLAVLLFFGVLGAIRMMQGREFYYPLVGKKLK
jgi:uncharacterized Tic20 family protein